MFYWIQSCLWECFNAGNTLGLAVQSAPGGVHAVLAAPMASIPGLSITPTHPLEIDPATCQACGKSSQAGCIGCTAFYVAFHVISFPPMQINIKL